MTPEEVAAMFGHGTDETAQFTYGKRQYAWPEDAASSAGNAHPIPEEVATVRQRLRFFAERQLFLEQAGQKSRKPGPANPAPGSAQRT